MTLDESDQCFFCTISIVVHHRAVGSHKFERGKPFHLHMTAASQHYQALLVPLLTRLVFLCVWDVICSGIHFGYHKRSARLQRPRRPCRKSVPASCSARTCVAGHSHL